MYRIINCGTGVIESLEALVLGPYLRVVLRMKANPTPCAFAVMQTQELSMPSRFSECGILSAGKEQAAAGGEVHFEESHMSTRLYLLWSPLQKYKCVICRSPDP